jgi:hypothetical protein
MKTYMPVTPGAIKTQEHTRPTFVPDSLNDLHGPTSGSVTLPLILDWTPLNTYDLESQSRTRRLYETVLSEATSETDITRYVNKSRLIGLWSELRLPRRVRIAWETNYPELRQ